MTEAEIKACALDNLKGVDAGKTTAEVKQVNQEYVALYKDQCDFPKMKNGDEYKPTCVGTCLYWAKDENIRNAFRNCMPRAATQMYYASNGNRTTYEALLKRLGLPDTAIQKDADLVFSYKPAGK